MTKKINFLFLFFFISIFFIPVNTVKASGTCNYSINGESTTYVGETLNLTVRITESGATGGIRNVQGNLAVSGSFSLISATSANATLNPSYANGSFGGAGTGTVVGSANILNLIVKANSVGTGLITLSALKAGDSNVDPIVCNSSATKQLTSTNPPSGNADLATLSVGGYNLSPSFSSNNTNYTVNVESDVNSVNINATVADSGAGVSGLGSKNLSYGNNAIKVVVTAKAGNKKTYTININRQDIRSNDNNLKSLTPSVGSINFSKDNTTYNLEVDYNTTKVTFNAVANDSKAKVTINSPEIPEEQTTVATIVVTAENGSKKTYTINITRRKNPNKLLSKENSLEYLTPSIGILSPVFSSSNTNYEIYLPYEITTITFEYAPLEKTYAKVEIEKVDELKIGENKFIFKVTAEDNSVKEYIVTVHRFKEVSSETNNNTYLQNLILENGKLTSTFDKNKEHYYFTGELKIKEAIPEDSDANVKIVNTSNKAIILVTSPSGDIRVYILEKQKFDIIPYLIGGTIGILVTISSLYIINKKIKKEKNHE